MTNENVAQGQISVSLPNYRDELRDTFRTEPAPQQVNTIRRIEIKQLEYGYVVEVGCSTFAVESSERLLQKLAQYINNPAATEKKFFERTLF